MTMKDFDNMRQNAERAWHDTKESIETLSGIFNILQDKKNKVPPETVELVREELNQAIIAANQASGELLHYKNLLDDIARSSTLKWPPVCVPEGS